MLTAMLLVALAACGNSRAGRSPAARAAGTDSSEVASTVAVSAPEPLPPLHAVTVRIRIQTTRGAITAGLYGDEAPSTVANFLRYIEAGFYPGKIFHRVIPGFMIQGGGFDTSLARAETPEPIRLEVIPGLKHEPGVISMARTQNPHSATSQFFICVAEAPQLNGGYAAFGKVEDGMDVVYEISRVQTHEVETASGPMADVPVSPVVIDGITRI